MSRPLSSDRQTPTAEMPHHTRCGFTGSTSTAWAHRPPAPGNQLGCVGWSLSELTGCQLWPSSSLVNRPALSTPAQCRFSPQRMVQIWLSLRSPFSGYAGACSICCQRLRSVPVCIAGP